MPLVVREVELFRQHEVFSVFCNHINVHWEKGGAGHRLVPKEKVDVAEEAVLSFDDMLQASMKRACAHALRRAAGAAAAARGGKGERGRTGGRAK